MFKFPFGSCGFVSIDQGLQPIVTESHISYYTTVRGPEIVRNVIVSGYVPFYQINKCFGNISRFYFWQTVFAVGWNGSAGRIWPTDNIWQTPGVVWQQSAKRHFGNRQRTEHLATATLCAGYERFVGAEKMKAAKPRRPRGGWFSYPPPDECILEMINSQIQVRAIFEKAICNQLAAKFVSKHATLPQKHALENFSKRPAWNKALALLWVFRDAVGFVHRLALTKGLWRHKRQSFLSSYLIFCAGDELFCAKADLFCAAQLKVLCYCYDPYHVSKYTGMPYNISLIYFASWKYRQRPMHSSVQFFTYF